MNTVWLEKHFRAPVCDLRCEIVAVNTRPYGTTQPTIRKRGPRDVIDIPHYHDGRYYVSAKQVKNRQRYRAAQLAAGLEFHFNSMNSALQTYQGGFIAKALRMSDRDQLLATNPVVYLHGAGAVGGALRYSDMVTRDPITDDVIEIRPVVRTDSSQGNIYEVTEQAKKQFTAHQNSHHNRGPYVKALVRGPTLESLAILATVLEEDDRQAEAEAARDLIAAKDTSRATIRNWLSAQKERLQKQMEKDRIPNVEIRQALPGYKVLPPNLQFDASVEGLGLTDWHVGLAILSFQQRDPRIGGHAAQGCGGYFKQCIRVSVSDTQNDFAFDCLLKVEPFKPMMICFDDAAIASWADTTGLAWQPIEPGDRCAVTRGIRSWIARKAENDFNFNFVPAGQREDDDGGDDDGDLS